ncbi:MAG: hypothetical protein OXS29_05200 [bacterium]|nr:hypothetical protein [bacterium]MDE0289114.1 hypothetical protein [bacterium]MDE0440385.1 hypothetical protein [bacterium]
MILRNLRSMFFPKNDAEMVESLDALLDADYLGHYAGHHSSPLLLALIRRRAGRSKRATRMEAEGHKVDPRSFNYKKPKQLFPRW